MVKPYLHDAYDLGLAEMPRGKFPWAQLPWALSQRHGTVLFFTKAALRRLRPETAAVLKKRGCFICFDYVDSDLNKMKRRDIDIDIHVASSIAAKHVLEGMQAEAAKASQNIPGKVMVLHHNADPYFYEARIRPCDAVKPVYIGLRQNAFLTEKLESRIAVLDIVTVQCMRRQRHLIPDFNLHYAVRPPAHDGDRLIRKPFTKGFNAAALDVPILVNRSVDDAEDFLGADYPFIVDRAEEEDVVETLNFARDSFGTKDWRMALQRMEDVRMKISPASLAGQLSQMVRELTVS